MKYGSLQVVLVYINDMCDKNLRNPSSFKFIRSYCTTLYYCLPRVESRKHIRVMCGRGKALSLWNLDADASLSCWAGRRRERAADWKTSRYITSTLLHITTTVFHLKAFSTWAVKKLVDNNYILILHLHFQHFYFKGLAFLSLFRSSPLDIE